MYLANVICVSIIKYKYLSAILLLFCVHLIINEISMPGFLMEAVCPERKGLLLCGIIIRLQGREGEKLTGCWLY